MTMRFLLTSLTLAWIAGMTGIVAAAAQDYPTRPITLVVPQAPGGGNDVIARIIADHMSRLLGEQIVVENRTGAGGTLGTRQVAKSAPDGYTLVMGSTGTMAIAPTAYPNAGYDPRRDFAPVGMIARSAIALVVGPSVSAPSVRELVQVAPGAARQAHLRIRRSGHGQSSGRCSVCRHGPGQAYSRAFPRRQSSDHRCHWRAYRYDLQQPAAHSRQHQGRQASRPRDGDAEAVTRAAGPADDR